MHKTHYHAKIIYLYFDKIHVYPWGMVISKKFSGHLNLFPWNILLKDRLWHAFLSLSAYIWSCMYLSPGIISDLAQSWQRLWRFFKHGLKWLVQWQASFSHKAFQSPVNAQLNVRNLTDCNCKGNVLFLNYCSVDSIIFNLLKHKGNTEKIKLKALFSKWQGLKPIKLEKLDS